MDVDSEEDKIKLHVDKGNYHAAINIAISALNECRRNKDQNGVDAYLNLIKDNV